MFNNKLEIIHEDIYIHDKLYVEITYFFDELHNIKSYYIMTDEEYKSLSIMIIDIYIENFINNEILTKDKLDIHIINNIDNIKIIDDFLKIYGNPFDIINIINIKNNHINNNREITICHKDFIDEDSDELVSSITDIINTYNKNNFIDNNKIIEISRYHPEILNDEIIKNFFPPLIP